ncbi:MAG TPA: CapA family protein [Longilinea sp.]|nr:CapA family protein [Longilinea sp.]
MPFLFRLKWVPLIGLALILSGCSVIANPASPVEKTVEPTPSSTISPTITASTTPTPTPAPPPLRVWIDPDLPAAFRTSMQIPIGFEISNDADKADIPISWVTSDEGLENSVQWIFALVAPFPTLFDEVSSASIRSSWVGESAEPFNQSPLLMSAETAAALTVLWGQPAPNAIKIFPQEKLVDTSWAERPGWAIVPFEDLTPRWKVIQVDGLSPLDPDLDVSQYPLKATIGWEAKAGIILPEEGAAIHLVGNRNAAHLARVFMTGTTAMVRQMALRMEEKGVLYPARRIGDLLKSADLTHISNEVSFYSHCPPAKPLRGSLRFCTSPEYIQTLKAVGADVIELTGNHLLDWGTEAFSETLELYKTNGFTTYGGGWTQEQARQPNKMEVNGNKLAFLGCNPAGPEADWATAENPGSAQCDYDWMESQIRALRADGYLPIVTIQHIEVYDYKPTSAQRVISERMAKAGAVLISGSQSHFPQGFTFVGETLVHYGLGNTFFDQMDFGSSRGFLDRSVFYEGRLISTELFTIKLEDYAQPRLMTPEERQAMLEKVFIESGWLSEK